MAETPDYNRELNEDAQAQQEAILAQNEALEQQNEAAKQRLQSLNQQDDRKQDQAAVKDANQKGKQKRQQQIQQDLRDQAALAATQTQPAQRVVPDAGEQVDRAERQVARAEDNLYFADQQVNRADTNTYEAQQQQLDDEKQAQADDEKKQQKDQQKQQRRRDQRQRRQRNIRRLTEAGVAAMAYKKHQEHKRQEEQVKNDTVERQPLDDKAMQAGKLLVKADAQARMLYQLRQQQDRCLQTVSQTKQLRDRLRDAQTLQNKTDVTDQQQGQQDQKAVMSEMSDLAGQYAKTSDQKALAKNDPVKALDQTRSRVDSHLQDTTETLNKNQGLFKKTSQKVMALDPALVKQVFDSQQFKLPQQADFMREMQQNDANFVAPGDHKNVTVDVKTDPESKNLDENVVTDAYTEPKTNKNSAQITGAPVDLKPLKVNNDDLGLSDNQINPRTVDQGSKFDAQKEQEAVDSKQMDLGEDATDHVAETAVDVDDRVEKLLEQNEELAAQNDKLTKQLRQKPTKQSFKDRWRQNSANLADHSTKSLVLESATRMGHVAVSFGKKAALAAVTATAAVATASAHGLNKAADKINRSMDSAVASGVPGQVARESGLER